jgi:hypothetical protein
MLVNMTPRQKALKINLDQAIYGSFAEIGAGQEVARWFFKAGAASMTVAKSMSAYDMIFSDAIYGKETSGRYVCEERLVKMLKYEYNLLEERLRKVRGDNTQFFSFANTVAARNFKGDNESHGWLGVRFKRNVNEDYSEVVVHVRMLDLQNVQQQEALGIIGVNLLYAAFYYQDDEKVFLNSLMEEIEKKRIEINYIKTSGPCFKNFNNRLLNLQLVKEGYTKAVIFDQQGNPSLASDELYKKNVMVVRGSYRPPTLVNFDMIKSALKTFSQDKGIETTEIESIAEITMGNLSSDGEFSNEDFLARIDLITALGTRVLISNYHQYYMLADFFNNFKVKNLAIVLGTYNFQQIFDDEYSKSGGGLLTGLGHLFVPNVSVYLYPYLADDQKTHIQLENMPYPAKYKHLYQHLKDSGQIIDINCYNKNILHIYSKKVLNMIKNSEAGWEQYVPESVAKTINDKCLFGNPCDINKKK